MEGILEALSGKHSPLDSSLQRMSIRLPDIGVGVERNQLLAVTTRQRGMT